MSPSLEEAEASKSLKAQRVRRMLAGVAREDSDDELGLEDHPWKWLYKDNGLVEENDESNSDDDAAAVLSRKTATIKTRPARKAKTATKREIVGARMGAFECRVGDTVLLKAEANNEAWVGIICEFVDMEEEKCANFMWFSGEKEIRNKAKKRMDAMHNELYITPSWDINPLASINGKAKILSVQSFMSKHPSGKISRGSKEFGKTFICRRGCNTRTCTYTEEFIWDQVFSGSGVDIESLIERVQTETKASRKKRTTRKAQDVFETEDDNDDETIRTPRKKRKTASIAGTPHKVKTPSKLLTPSHKRIIVKKPLEFTPLGTRMLSQDHVQSSPFQIARSRLHVSAVPASLPCREDEFAEVYSHLETAITDGTGACIYISGTPGTGKTATVREVVAQLNASVLAEELDDFIFVEINGMKVTDPHQSYALLWEALKGDRVSPSQALDLLEREFNHPSPRRVPCVVLMDELDQLVTRNQSVMYNFFNWPGLRHSRLIVLAVANTMDLPERTLSNKISSRLGMHRITFGGYNHTQLSQIITTRLSGVPGSVVDADAIMFAARKVSSVSGDARRALDICRRAVEIAESEATNHASMLSSPSKKSAGFKETIGRVTIATIRKAINEATSSPLQQYLKSLPLAHKLLLAALLSKLRRTGLTESMLGEILEEAKRITKMATSVPHLDHLLSEISPTAAFQLTNGRQEPAQLVKRAPRVLGMGCAAIELMEAGVIGVERSKGDRMGKIRLCVGDEEVKLAFRDDLEVKGLGF